MAEAASVNHAVVVRAWRRIQAASLLVVGLSLYSVIVLAMELIPPLVIFGTLFVAMGALVWVKATNRWISIVTAALALLALAGNAPFLIEDVAHPETWAGFIPGAISILAGLSAVAACAMSFRPTRAEPRTYASSVAGLGVSLIVLSLVISFTASSDTAEAGDITVVAEDVYFPETLEAPAGRVAFFLENRDVFRHTFVIEGHEVKAEMPGSKDRRLETELAAGEYRYICDVPGHERMAGTLTVR